MGQKGMNSTLKTTYLILALSYFSFTKSCPIWTSLNWLNGGGGGTNNLSTKICTNLQFFRWITGVKIQPKRTIKDLRYRPLLIESQLELNWVLKEKFQGKIFALLKIRVFAMQNCRWQVKRVPLEVWLFTW